MIKEVALGVEGMSCAACSAAVEKYLKKQKGVSAVSVNLVLACAAVEYDDEILQIADLERMIKESGYKSSGIYKAGGEEAVLLRKKIFFAVYGVLIVILFYVSMGAMIGLPLPKFIDMSLHPVAYASVLAAITAAFMVYGLDIFIKGVKTALHRAPNMDTLVTLGVFASLGYSVFSFLMLIKGRTEFVHRLYFESCCVIIYFIKLGRSLDEAGKKKTSRAIKELVQITPNFAFVKRGDELQRVGIDEIQKGDSVVCRAGDKIAVDGEVISGSAHVNEAFITGESKPSQKIVGSKVVAGSVNLDGYIEYRAERIGKDSTVSEIVRLVVDATNSKMPIAAIADKVSGIFVPIVMIVAVLGFIGYLAAGAGVYTALTTAITVLVVACPCALGLATPLAVVVAEGKCASAGILVKKSKTLEIADKADVIIFDKTGTLTSGRLKIARTLNYSDMTEEELLAFSCALESQSTHPIATAFMEKAKSMNIGIPAAEDIKMLAGKGMFGVVGGKKVFMGSARILEEAGVPCDRADDERALAEGGNSIVYLVIDGKIAALYGVNDVVKPNARKVVSALRQRGMRVMMLTGDNKSAAEIFARELGIDDYRAEVMPADKAETVKKLKAENKVVVMCGDGVNDSPALAASDVAISVYGGTDVAADSSDVVMMTDNLEKILDLFTVAKKTVGNIRQNLFWAFFYNCLMIPIALGALRFAGITISPMIAGLAMVLSGLTVVLNALRLNLVKTSKDHLSGDNN